MAEQTRTGHHILVVEDDQNLRSTLVFNLERQGFRTSESADGAEGLRLAKECPPDLIILDLMLPSMDGRDVCRAIREDSRVPIIILTALDREVDIINGLNLGADDYIGKPFSVRELVARINALLRRTALQDETPAVIQAGALTIFLREHRAELHGRELHLPLKEFGLLVALASKAGEVCTRAELLETVWGKDIVVDQRNIDVRIRWLRKQLESFPDGASLIQTVHGVGYRFAGGSTTS